MSVQIDIPTSYVEELQVEERAKRSDAARLIREADEIARKIEAARILRPDLFPSVPAALHVLRRSPEVVEPTPVASERRPTLAEKVVEVVEASARPLQPAEIRKSIAAQGDNDLIKSENYLYMVLKRLLQRGKLAKYRDGYGSPTRPPEAEASGLPL
jgi:hypothetical protein